MQIQNIPELESKPIPLIQFQEQKFEITPQAIQFLKSLESPFGIITIVGKYRTGKSLFLNKVLLNNNSFKVSPTINSCTKGLWISKKIVKSEHPEAPDLDIIVIDSEGFGAMEESDAYNNKILLFALLLSSYFIYNSVGSIDEKSLNNLNVITNLAKELQQKNLGNDKIQQQFPTFMWLVRDFTLKLVDNNGCAMQPKQYLEYALEMQKGVSDAIENKNKIRRMIKHFFKERDCFTLVTPVENQIDLQNLNCLDDSALRPEFIQQVQILRQKILRKVKPKKLKNRKLNGETFIQLANSYISAINNGSLPNIDLAWKSINTFEINQTIFKAKELVSKKSIEFINEIKHEQSFVQFEKQLLEQTYAFMKRKMSSQESLQEQYGTIKQFIENSIVQSKSKNKKKSLEVLVDKFYESYEQFKYDGVEEQLDKKWNKFQKQFKQQYKDNPSIKQFLLQQLYPLKFQTISSVMKKQSQIIKSQQLEKKSIKQALEMKVKQCQKSQNELQSSFCQSEKNMMYLKTRLDEEAKIKMIELGYLQKELTEVKEDLSKQQVRGEHMSREIKEKDREITELKMRLSALGLNLKQSDDNRNYSKKQLQILKQNLTYKMREIQQLKTLTHELKTQIQQSVEREQNIINRNKIQIQTKSSQYQNLVIKYEYLQKELSNNQQKMTKLESALQSQSIRITKQQKLYETMLQTLKINLQSERQHTIELIEANKNMAFALKHLEQRFQQAQQKQKKLKQFKRCFKNSSCMQCQNCSKLFIPTIFPQHLNVCILGSENLKKLENDKQKLLTPKVEITVKQTLLKDSDSKPYTEYVLQIKKQQKSWIVNRKYKQFCDLHSQLKTLLPGVHLSDCSYIVNPQEGIKKSLLVEERRKILEQYLHDLAENPHIIQQPIWRQFIQDNTQSESIQSMIAGSATSKLAISTLLKNSNNMLVDINSPEKQNHFDSNRQQQQHHKTPEQFLKIWNERNLRTKEISKTKKVRLEKC